MKYPKAILVWAIVAMSGAVFAQAGGGNGNGGGGAAGGSGNTNGAATAGPTANGSPASGQGFLPASETSPARSVMSVTSLPPI
jgi:hypothetical protein